ncbi:hypothetical protein SGPA1_11583 [Streptomyces misionensis JCM 4497]
MRGGLLAGARGGRPRARHPGHAAAARLGVRGARHAPGRVARGTRQPAQHQRGPAARHDPRGCTSREPSAPRRAHQHRDLGGTRPRMGHGTRGHRATRPLTIINGPLRRRPYGAVHGNEDIGRRRGAARGRDDGGGRHRRAGGGQHTGRLGGHGRGRDRRGDGRRRRGGGRRRGRDGRRPPGRDPGHQDPVGGRPGRRGRRLRRTGPGLAQRRLGRHRRRRPPAAHRPAADVVHGGRRPADQGGLRRCLARHRAVGRPVRAGRADHRRGGARPARVRHPRPPAGALDQVGGLGGCLPRCRRPDPRGPEVLGRAARPAVGELTGRGRPRGLRELVHRSLVP